MKNGHAQTYQTTRRILLIACVAALAVAFTVSLPQLVYAADIVPPRLPPDLQPVPPENKAFLEGHAVGTQNYICLPSGDSFVWTFFGPQATLFDDDGEQIITHFLSPNPDESDTPRPTWQHSLDTSTVWAMQVMGGSSSDPDFVKPGAIPWLLLQVVGIEPDPTSGAELTGTTFIQRLNTSGGITPSTGCAKAGDIGKRAFVPYTADYFFYEATTSE
jgi:hypothetical protein